MGLEIPKCKATIRGESLSGRLHVDSKQLTFQAKGFQWATPVGKGTSAKVVKNDLIVRRGSKSATFHIGRRADAWADKILNPPSRGKKLGLKPGLKYYLLGDFDQSFLDELHFHDLQAARTPRTCDIAFVLMHSTENLLFIDKVAKSCSAGTHIWGIWPKGIQAIRQSEVIARARAFGMGPGKGISFDDTCSAMRFTKKTA